MMKIFDITPADIFQVFEIESACFSDEALTKSGLESCIANPLYRCVCVKDGEKIAGFAIFLTGDAAEVIDVVTAPAYRRMGVAKMLLGHFLQGCDKDVFLEVREGNTAARALYKSFGFYEISVRKNYYSNPAEDAVIMKRDKQI